MFNLYKNKKSKIIVLAPHVDDGEFGCGASLAKFIRNGCDIYYYAFSKALIPDQLMLELNNSSSVLNINKNNINVYDFPVRSFPKYRQDILEILVDIYKNNRPDLVFLPSSFDTHQDHKVIFEEGFRAFKGTSMLGYELPWNNINFSTDCFISINREEAELKIKSVECYKSQSNKYYATREAVSSLMRVRGVQVFTEYAEAFENIRWVLR